MPKQTPQNTESEEQSHEFVQRPLGRKRASAKASNDVNGNRAKMEKQLTEIYENGDGSMPDMSTFEKGKRRSFWRASAFLFISCAFLGAVAWLGFFILPGSNRFSERDVIVSVAGPSEAIPGGEVFYRVRYRNAQRVPLSQAVLQMHYPAGFQVDTSTVAATNDAKTEWALGDLEAEESGYIDITGRLVGNVGEEQSFRVFFTYVPANFNSTFQKVAAMATKLAGSPVNVTLVGPETVAPGEEVALTLRLNALPGSPTPPLFIELDPGTTFVKKSSQPNSEPLHNYRWKLPAGTTEKEIIIRGSFTGGTGEGDTVFLPVAVRALVDEKNENTAYLYATTTYQATLHTAPVALALTVNGASADATVSPGEILASSLILTNHNSEPLRHAIVRLMIDAPANKDRGIVQWTSLDDSQNGELTGEQINADSRRGTLRWTEKEVVGLGTIGPNGEVKIDIRVPIKSVNETDYGTVKGSAIILVGDVEFTDAAGKKQRVSTVPVTLTLNSDLSLNVSRAKSGVGAGEVHTVTWTLTNTVHDLTDISVEADMYGDINFEEANIAVPAGKITFDDVKKKLRWTIPAWPDRTETLKLTFPIQVKTVNATQTTLMSKVRLEANDVVTGKKIMKQGNELSLK
mgnify:CR=1 FL=1